VRKIAKNRTVFTKNVHGFAKNVRGFAKKDMVFAKFAPLPACLIDYLKNVVRRAGCVLRRAGRGRK
jgi:hypothetical protein